MSIWPVIKLMDTRDIDRAMSFIEKAKPEYTVEAFFRDIVKAERVPVTDAPGSMFVLGWAKELERRDDGLYAEISGIDPLIRQLVDPNFSSAIMLDYQDKASGDRKSVHMYEATLIPPTRLLS